MNGRLDKVAMTNKLMQLKRELHYKCEIGEKGEWECKGADEYLNRTLDVLDEYYMQCYNGVMTEEMIRKISYTKEEVDILIAEAVAEARRIDEESMRKHNRDATIISMILGFTCLALFVDGLLRILGIIPPFAGLDVNIIDQIVEKVEQDVIPQVEKYKGYIPRI